MSVSLFKRNKTQFEPAESPKPAVDFHVTMVQKIDKILQEHALFEDKTIPDDHSVRFADFADQHPLIEPRLPLEKTVEMSTPKLTREVLPHPHSPKEQGGRLLFSRQPELPLEFRSELSFATAEQPAEFRFISEFPESHLQPQEVLRRFPDDAPRVEIIDLRTFMKLENQEGKTPEQQKNREKPGSSRKTKQNPPSDPHVEILYIGKQGTLFDHMQVCASSALSQSEKKAHLFYLTSKRFSDKSIKKLEKEQAYIPIDLEEKAVQLKQKSYEEEQKKKKHEEQQQEDEQEKQTSVSKKQQKQEEKKKQQMEKQQKKEEKRLKKLQEQEEKKQHFCFWKKQAKDKVAEESIPVVDDDIKKVLLLTDDLLGKLPENVIEEFAQSKDFELYERVLSKYKIRS